MELEKKLEESFAEAGIDFCDLALLEAISYTDALKLLGLDKNFTADELKKAFRKAALKAHPDQGGSDEAMKKLNDANDVLKKSSSSAGSRVDWEEIDRKEKEAVVEHSNQFYKAFDPKKYQSYLEKHSGLKLSSDVSKLSFGKAISHSGKFKAVFASEGNTTYFEVSFYIYHKHGTGALASPGASFQANLNRLVYHDGRKHKMARADFTRDDAMKMAKDPSVVFPEKKIKSVFKAKKTAKKRAFKRRDFEAGLKAHFPAWFYPRKDVYKVVLNKTDEIQDRFSIALVRQTLGGAAAYSLNGLWKGSKRIADGFTFFNEDEEGLQSLRDLAAKITKVLPDEKKAAALYKKHHKDVKPKNESYKASDMETKDWCDQITETFELDTVPVEEKSDVDNYISALVSTGWSGNNKAQMKAIQLLKGLATSDDPKANAFMKKLDAFTSGLKKQM